MADKAGDRKSQILQKLAEMLQQPQAEKITTAALAARLGISEAALYRHFASKAQMFESLILFVEQALFRLIDKIQAEEASSHRQVEAILSLLLGFTQKNPGLTRVLTGEALVHEDGRLQARIQQLHLRLEEALLQGLQKGSALADAAARANLLMCFVIGRWQAYAKSGFTQLPLDYWPQQWRALTSGPFVA